MFIGFISGQCDDNPLGDINDDSILDILDIVSTVSLILYNNDISIDIQEIADINNDELIDVLDVILVVQKVLQPVPSQVSILSVVNSIESLSIAWTSNSDPTFANYKIYKSSNINGPLELVETIYDQQNG